MKREDWILGSSWDMQQYLRENPNHYPPMYPASLDFVRDWLKEGRPRTLRHESPIWKDGENPNISCCKPFRSFFGEKDQVVWTLLTSLELGLGFAKIYGGAFFSRFADQVSSLENVQLVLEMKEERHMIDHKFSANRFNGDPDDPFFFPVRGSQRVFVAVYENGGSWTGLVATHVRCFCTLQDYNCYPHEFEMIKFQRGDDLVQEVEKYMCGCWEGNQWIQRKLGGIQMEEEVILNSQQALDLIKASISSS